MNQFKRCKRCGKIFQYRMGSYCEDCLREMDDKYKLVRDYLYECPNATVKQVVEDTGVEEELIEVYLKEGRLQMKETTGFLRCEKCGAPITKGRMCEKCQGAVNQLIEKGSQIAAAKEASRRKLEQELASKGGYKSNVMKNK